MTIIRTRIKVCGITNIADATVAVLAGVDALGFIFADKSPRKIDPEQARDIILSLPPFVDAVGVFVNEDVSVVEEIAQYCGLTIVQLHGSETSEYCEGMSRRVVKVISMGPGFDKSIFGDYADVAEAFLLDTRHGDKIGGTGKVFDWGMVEKMDIPRPFVLAGGLTPANVAEAINVVRPFAVDANSGVESEPGVKDSNLIQQFVEAVKKADCGLIAC